MCSTEARWAFAALPIFCNMANPYRRTRPSNPEWIDLSELLVIASDLTSAFRLPPDFRRPKLRRRGYYAGPPKTCWTKPLRGRFKN
jgi:hypothetical protein